MRLFLSSNKHFGYLNASGTVETHWSTRWLGMNCIPKCPTVHSRFFSLLLSEELTLGIESPSLSLAALSHRKVCSFSHLL